LILGNGRGARFASKRIFMKDVKRARQSPNRLCLDSLGGFDVKRLS
jgi:hypothetical protein